MKDEDRGERDFLILHPSSLILHPFFPIPVAIFWSNWSTRSPSSSTVSLTK